jgi:hypothetical protein
MPLMKYLVFVGSALVLLLLAMNWLSPEPTAEPVYSSPEASHQDQINRDTARKSGFRYQHAVYRTAFERYARCGAASTIGVYI